MGVAAPVLPGTTVRLSGRRAVRSAAEPTGGLLILAAGPHGLSSPVPQFGTLAGLELSASTG
ncbi:MAG: hypothetical protein MZV64_04700 [Ignavibacteriales bacterium]|nr:hypothetical protein [Ignavibacteriales bacterium]